MAKKENTLQPIPEHIPESLKGWVFKEHRNQPLTFELIAEQIFDLSTLSDSAWSFFEWFQYQIHHSFQELMNEALAFRLIDSKEKVRKYFEYELLEGKDPFHLISKISMSGAGIRSLYQRILTMASVETMEAYKKNAILRMLSYWDEATVDILCDKVAFFTRTANGNEDTLSEFFGTSLSFDVRLIQSPLIKDGRYLTRFLDALDYDGITAGKYPRDDRNEYFYQDLLLQYVFYSQSSDHRLSKEFWEPLQQIEDFSHTNHQIAAAEHFENVNELLVQAIMYAWKEEQRNKIVYAWVSRQMLDNHFKGRTAEAKFLSQIHTDMEKVDANLIDYEQISKKRPDMLILLGSELAEHGLSITYAIVGETYQEETELFHPQKGFLTKIDPKISKKLKKMIEDFEVAKQAYLEKLAEQIFFDEEKTAPRQNV